MDLAAQLGDLMKSLGLSSNAVDEALSGEPDLNEKLKEAEELGSIELDENPALADIMRKMNSIAESVAAQGGIMPDDVDNLMEQMQDTPGGLEGLLGSVGDMFGGMFGDAYDEIDLDEEIFAYQPQAEDAADRAFVAALKKWLKETIAEIPEKDVCAFEIGYHLEFEDEALEHPVYNLWLAYNTEKTRAENRERYGEEVWNWINWTDNQFRTLPDEPFAAWRKAQGYDEDHDYDDEITQHVYDLAAVAVMELHAEKFTEQLFGKKLPFIIEDFEYYQKTAIRAAKVNGKELFDSVFYRDCGFEPDEEA